MSNGDLLERIPKPPKSPKLLPGWWDFLSCAMNIVRIAIGAIYLDDCTRQHYIPIYLIVMGVFGPVLGVLQFLISYKKFQDIVSDRIRNLILVLVILIMLFLFCWIIAGACLNCVFGCLKPLFYIYINEGNNSQYKNNNRTNSSLQNDHKTKTVSTKTEGIVWIFPIYEPNYNKNTTNVDLYCDKTLYLFAFWSTISGYILMGPIVFYKIYWRYINGEILAKKDQ